MSIEDEIDKAREDFLNRANGQKSEKDKTPKYTGDSVEDSRKCFAASMRGED